MNNSGLGTLIGGIVLLCIGILFMWYWLPALIQVIMGAIGIIFALVGIAGIAMGYRMIR